MRLFHISDLHCEADPNTNNLRGLPERVGALAFAMDRPDDVCVCTGDVVDDGGEEQYARALEILEPLDGRILVCPGNHDKGAHGILWSQAAETRFDYFERALGSHRVTTIGTVCFIGLDSTLSTSSPLDAACGRIGETQLSWLEERLRSSQKAGLKTVVYMHHHAHRQQGLEDFGLWLLDRRELRSEVVGVADMLLCGHTHAEYDWQDRRRFPGFSYHCAEDFGPAGRGWRVWEV